MKKILITLTVLAALTLTACGNDSEVTVTTTTTTTTTEAVVTTVPDADEGTTTEIITTVEQEVTTTTPAPVEDITTTTVTDEVTTEITTIPEEVTTEATTTTEAAPAWVDEPMDSTTMYAATACYVRKDAVVGSDALYVVSAGKAVTIVGKTDTGYYKLSDGGYIHSDYLSTQKPVEEVVTTTVPVEQDTPTTTTTVATPEYELPPYNHTNATCNGIEIVLTEEDAEAVAAEMLILVNDLRTSLGLNELQPHPTLEAGVRIRAYELITLYGHTRPDGTEWYTAYNDLNFGTSGMGENVAGRAIAGNAYIGSDGKYHFDAKATAMCFFEGWKNSSGHYATMIKPTYKYFAFDMDVASGKYNSSSKINKSGLYIYGVQNFKS